MCDLSDVYQGKAKVENLVAFSSDNRLYILYHPGLQFTMCRFCFPLFPPHVLLPSVSLYSIYRWIYACAYTSPIHIYIHIYIHVHADYHNCARYIPQRVQHQPNCSFLSSATLYCSLWLKNNMLNGFISLYAGGITSDGVRSMKCT
jgi:hypothetical protein